MHVGPPPYSAVGKHATAYLQELLVIGLATRECSDSDYPGSHILAEKKMSAVMGLTV
jgi:hypothetical protein